MSQEKLGNDDTSYSDEYDRETVELCRNFERELDKRYGQDDQISAVYKKLALYFFCGERYINKFETINARKKALREYYQKLENTHPKFNALCLVCHTKMDVAEKTIYGQGKGEQVLFYFKCLSCLEIRRFFQDGTEHRPPPQSCAKCRVELEKKSSRTGSRITTSLTCANCDYHEDYVLDLDEAQPKSKTDKDFLKDRERFCLTETEGRNYFDQVEFLKTFQFPSKNPTATEDLKPVKVLSIFQARELLTTAFEQNGLKELAFGKPEAFRGSIILPYTAQDTLSVRDKRTVSKEIKKIIEQTFDGTNWRSTSEEITYNLGLVDGRIRGSENLQSFK